MSEVSELFASATAEERTKIADALTFAVVKSAHLDDDYDSTLAVRAAVQRWVTGTGTAADFVDSELDPFVAALEAKVGMAIIRRTVLKALITVLETNERRK